MTKLEERINKERETKEILIVSHTVLGYPSFVENEEAIEALVSAGVEIIELQIPFSDPEADGPFFTFANQKSVAQGTKLKACFEFAQKTTSRFKTTSFLFMTYFNIVFKYGVESFIREAAQAGILGIIIPDLPIEEAEDLMKFAKTQGIAPIFMATPLTPEERLKRLVKKTQGFLYCQARTGVTGHQTTFDDEVDRYIQRCREHSPIPLAMGFGITNKRDVDFLKNKVDIAICCTQAVKIFTEEGKEALEKFMKELR